MSKIKGEYEFSYVPEWLEAGRQYGAPDEVLYAAYQAGMEAGAGTVANRVLMALGLVQPEQAESAIIKP